MKYWYYHESGEQKGPITEDEFRKLFQSGSLPADTLVWTEGLKDWQQARVVDDLVPSSFAPPPPPIPGTFAAPSVARAGASDTCPLCGSAKHMAKAKSLYGHLVCKKCYYKLANLRQGAYFIDLLIYYAVVFVSAILLGIVMAIAGFPQPQIERAGSILPWILLVVMLGKDCFSGHSAGKALCGVRVIDKTTGEPGGLASSFKRNLPLLIPFVPLVVGGQLCKGPRLGDDWANTKVIWKKYANHPIFAPTR